MWLYCLGAVIGVLQWSVVTGEGSPDQHTLSLCRLWEDCIRTAETAEHEEVAQLEAFCEDVAHMLKKRDVGNCGKASLQFPDTQGQSNNGKRSDNDAGPLPALDRTSSAVSMSGRDSLADCSEIYTAQLFNTVSSGVHAINPVGVDNAITVYCDQTTDGGGWTVIQRRFDGSLDFNRPYDDFRYGFGSANGEQWLGLENMYRLTNQNAYMLYIELVDWQGVVKYAKYSAFSVGSSSTNFRLDVGGYSGTAGDGFDLTGSDWNMNGQGFSARNVDHDSYSMACVGHIYGGAWWFNNCGSSSLNGPYLRPHDRTDYSSYGMLWYSFGGSDNTNLKKSKMMVRPVDFQP